MASFRFTLRRALLCGQLLFSLGLASAAYAVDVTDTRLLTQPAVSARRIAFVYAGDLWVCDRSGANVRRVTADAGPVSNPVFSPDGSLIAFSAQYDGNIDVYVVPADGGVPTRLTFHPGADIVQAFTPDGKAVLFTSPRAVFTNRYTQLFTVPVAGGVETPLPIPNASRATYAADDQHIAYSPLGPQFMEWKHYRGGTASRIFLYRASDHGVDQIPQPSSRANDVDPMWIGDTVYFRSDRDGEFNLYAFDTRSKSITALTHYTDFPVLTAGATAGSAATKEAPAIVYEQAGYLHLLDLNTKQDTRLKIGVAADLVETRVRFVKGAKEYVRHAAISPSGARAVFEFRGEIVTVPAEKGDPRNLTNSVAVHDRSPAWSPDGNHIAYFSDESGEYSLVIANQDGKSQPPPRKIKLAGGAGFYDEPVWSPDSGKIAYQDNSQSLFVLDVKTGTSKKVAQEPHYSPERTMTSSWSPDSKWVAYTVNTPASIQSVHVYSIDQDKSFAVTDGLSEVSQPVFDRSGKYLFFLGSTDAGPVKDWFAQSTADNRATEGIYVAVLRNDLPSPIAKESDEEKGASASDEEKKKTDEEKKKPLDNKSGMTKAAKRDDGAQDRKDSSGKDADEKDSKDAKDEKTSGGASAKPVVVRIDLDGLSTRILDLPIPVGDYASLQAGTEGQLYFLKRVDAKSSLERFDLKTRKTEQILPEVSSFIVSADGKKMLYRTKDTWSIVSLTKKVEPTDGKLALESVEVRVDPRAEWPEIFNEAWRINRDYFYAPNMHGVNWTAARDKYAAFLPDVTNRADLSRVIQWMCSELSVGHHRGGGGDTRLTANSIPGGLLGADYRVENGRYRFAKIYGGLNWNPELRAPLTEPGVNAKVGEYLIAVNGRDLRPPTNLYSFFENTSGKITEITLGPNPDGSGARTVSVVPIANEAALRNRDWVEGNLRKVEAATGGRVAYVYVPNTAALGYAYFKRYFYPQSTRDAIIVDERFNGGGQVADYYIDLLRRPLISYWATRYGEDIKTPAAGIHGPKVMITDETAGSGGDLLPFMFRQAKLGPIVGKRTWGGLVGVLGFPTLMDGGSITAPNLAIWTQDGWVVENEGVPPDIEVEQTPADVIAGHDPQLERAIAVVMDALQKDPPKHPTRPPYPVKVAPAPTSTGQP